MALLLSIGGARAASENAVPAAIHAAVTAAALEATHEHSVASSLVKRVYTARQFAGLWTLGSTITPQGQEMLRVLRDAGELGLKSADYNAEPLAAAQRQLASGVAAPDTPGNWSAQSVREAMQGNATRYVALAHPIPVLILYGTAFATEDGKILFFDDLYGHGQELAALLGP
jgi:murein L,D-transpeptidase YcbB/YkuD